LPLPDELIAGSLPHRHDTCSSHCTAAHARPQRLDALRRWLPGCPIATELEEATGTVDREPAGVAATVACAVPHAPPAIRLIDGRFPSFALDLPVAEGSLVRALRD
jgi:hypothetical protein